MTKKELKEIIAEEKAMYVKTNFCLQRFVHQKRYMIWKYLSYYRRSQYYKDRISSLSGLRRIIALIAYRFMVRRKNIFGEKCGVEISNNSRIGRRLNIWHSGVVIVGELGNDVAIRGNTVIGNKDLKCTMGTPTIGNGVEVGFGAAIIGNVAIADCCIIGANAVVTKDFLEPGTVIVGVPGRALKKGE